jgi:hypothetical protein
MLTGMTHHAGPERHIVSPKETRDALAMGSDDRVDFIVDGIVITIEPVDAPTSLMGCLAGSNLTKALEAHRRSEAKTCDPRAMRSGRAM